MRPSGRSDLGLADHSSEKLSNSGRTAGSDWCQTLSEIKRSELRSTGAMITNSTQKAVSYFQSSSTLYIGKIHLLFNIELRKSKFRWRLLKRIITLFTFRNRGEDFCFAMATKCKYASRPNTATLIWLSCLFCVPAINKFTTELFPLWNGGDHFQ